MLLHIGIRLANIGVNAADGYEVLLSNTQRLPIRYWKGGEMIGALDIHQTLLSYYERIYNL